jgi:hypothetical protein
VSIALLANENWPRPALLALRAAGLDVEAVTETMPHASDAQVLDLLPRADWVGGHLVVVSGRTLRRRALPSPT